MKTPVVKNLVLAILFFLPLCGLFAQVTVDTLYWGPGPQDEEDCWGMKYTCGEPTVKPDSVLLCLITKTDSKEVPMEIHAWSNAMSQTPFQTTAKLDATMVEALTGGIEDSPCHGMPYGCDEVYWINDSSANIVKIVFSMAGMNRADASYSFENAKFALSLLDKDGNVLFASNESRRQDPLFPDYQVKDVFKESLIHNRLRSWSLHRNSSSEIIMRVCPISDLTRDTLVNAHSINIVKNSLHSPLFDKIAVVRLDILPPEEKYDRILSQMEQVQKRIKKLSRSGSHSKEDLDFVKDFLLAPNCLLEGMYSEDIAACVDYNFTGGLDNQLAYFWYNANMEYLVISYWETESHSGPDATISEMSMLLSDFNFGIDSLENQYRSSDPNVHPAPSFITDNLLPFTQKVPSYRQYWRFVELVNSWKELIKPAMDILSEEAKQGNTIAQLHTGVVLENSVFLVFALGNWFDFKETYDTPLHWYLMAALNGSKEGEKSLKRLLDTENEEAEEEMAKWREWLDSGRITLDTYNRARFFLQH